MKKLIIFDMDGLMFDSEKLAGECLQEASKSYGYEISPEVRLELLGKNYETNAIYLKKVYGKDFPVDTIFELSRTFMDQHIDQYGLNMKKGLVELLDYLKEKKVLIVVASSSPKEVILKYLRINKVEDYFNGIISGDMVSRCKPDPEIFIHACRLFDISLSDALVLEDSVSGLQAAFHGDIDAICVPDLETPEYKYLCTALGCFNDLLEVKNFIQEKELV